MSRILAEENAEFTLADPQDPTQTCTVIVLVRTLLYEGGDEFLHISYAYEMSGECPQLHPFWGMVGMSEEGYIVHKNAMISAMVEHLLMPDEQLALVSGHMFPTDYKASIMRALSLFWD